MPTHPSAPGKVILFGEHAVVYGRPAIAAPVTQVRASATITPAEAGAGLEIVAADLETRFLLATAPEDDPLALAARLALDHLAAPPPDATLTIASTIPIASGMGSGAAVSAALIQSLAGHLGQPLEPQAVSDLVYEVEKIHHGTPSGIDNTVIAYQQPIYFVRGEPIQRLAVGELFTLLVADSGRASPTGQVVGQVRRAWKKDPAHYDALFDQIGDVTDEARRAIEIGDVDSMGLLMDENHGLLIELGVSSPQLNELVEAARLSGALGAKLSGAGRGGNVIALVDEADAGPVSEALEEAGATQVILTRIEPIDQD